MAENVSAAVVVSRLFGMDDEEVWAMVDALLAATPEGEPVVIQPDGTLARAVAGRRLDGTPGHLYRLSPLVAVEQPDGQEDDE